MTRHLPLFSLLHLILCYLEFLGSLTRLVVVVDGCGLYVLSVDSPLVLVKVKILN